MVLFQICDIRIIAGVIQCPNGVVDKPSIYFYEEIEYDIAQYQGWRL
jgi:hypothetical protein